MESAPPVPMQLAIAKQRRLAPEDWSAIAAAFDANEVAGLAAREYEQLFARILRLAPAPVGIGERWKSR